MGNDSNLAMISRICTPSSLEMLVFKRLLLVKYFPTMLVVEEGHSGAN